MKTHSRIMCLILTKNVPERKYFIVNPENLIANGPKKDVDVDVYPLPLKHDLHLHYVVL